MEPPPGHAYLLPGRAGTGRAPARREAEAAQATRDGEGGFNPADGKHGRSATFDGVASPTAYGRDSTMLAASSSVNARIVVVRIFPWAAVPKAQRV